MIVFEEIIMANGIAVLMMLFLLSYRRRSKKKIHASDKIYNVMAIIVLLGALCETLSFWVDGKSISCGRALNYMSNSLCFVGTVSVGFLWCLFVDLRVRKNNRRTFHNAKIVAIPWLIEILAVIYNLFGTGFLFTVSEDNIYQRSAFVALAYITLILYFAYSVFIVLDSRRTTLQLDFFPVQYFITPCLAGVAIQFFFYGITSSWVSVAIAMIFVQMQNDSENLLTDALSGLYNRRYLNAVLSKKDTLKGKPLFGIMMDVNDFKIINDKLGHSTGDQAIRVMGDILLKSMPYGGMPIRYGGDEFVVLMSDVTRGCADRTYDEINRNIEKFNEAGIEKFKISISVGRAKLGEDGDVEKFLTSMDERMYEAKRLYHLENDGKQESVIKN